MKKNILRLQGVKKLNRIAQKVIIGAGRPPVPPGTENPCIWVKCGPTTHCVKGVCIPN